MKKTSAASLFIALALGACSPLPPESLVQERGDFWQRADISSALHLRGRQAQQALNQDIARCVIDVRRLEQLAPIRERIPGDNRAGAPPDPLTPEGRLAQWDTPERQGDLYFEHYEFHDFETCMQAKGWERVDHLPHSVAEKARENYIESVTGEKPRRTVTVSKPEETADVEYDDLNR
ncbi:MAG: hypothetical protein EOM26_08155 [Alphaproteobacteria bacterium]|nr:hypothetical protein [Alphaproteobacteria bacterium]